MNATVDRYVIEQAVIRARLLSVTAGFPPDEIDDARQELLLDHLRRAPKFNRVRGDWGGFVRGVMRNQATVLISRRHRRARHEILAGDLPELECEGPSDFFETVAGDDPTAGLDISLDVQRVLRQLPCHLQRLAALLPDLLDEAFASGSQCKPERVRASVSATTEAQRRAARLRYDAQHQRDATEGS